MLTIILLSIGLPVLAGTAYLALRNRRPQFLADARGIALQTVIIMVVLLAIAGAIAGVLLTRGEEAATRLEAQDINTDPARQAALYQNEAACKAADFEWESNACGPYEVGDTANETQCRKSNLSFASNKCA